MATRSGDWMPFESLPLVSPAHHRHTGNELLDSIGKIVCNSCCRRPNETWSSNSGWLHRSKSYKTMISVMWIRTSFVLEMDTPFFLSSHLGEKQNAKRSYCQVWGIADISHWFSPSASTCIAPTITNSRKCYKHIKEGKKVQNSSSWYYKCCE